MTDKVIDNPFGTMFPMVDCQVCGGKPVLHTDGKWFWVACSGPTCDNFGGLDLGISGAIQRWDYDQREGRA